MPTAGYIAGPLHAYWIAEKITKVLLDKDKVTRFGKAGYKLVIGEVSLERQALGSSKKAHSSANSAYETQSPHPKGAPHRYRTLRPEPSARPQGA